VQAGRAAAAAKSEERVSSARLSIMFVLYPKKTGGDAGDAASQEGCRETGYT
jgi:hypothetical protein